MERELGRNPSTHFEKGSTIPNVALVNRTECRLLDSVASVYRNSEYFENFDALFGRKECTEADRKLAKSLQAFAGETENAMYNAQYAPNISEPGGWRKPNTLNDFQPFVASGRQVQEMFDMVALVAVQPEVDIPPYDENDRTQFGELEHVNRTILQARVMTELLLDTFEEGDLQAISRNVPDANTPVHNRYLAQREMYRESIKPQMESFEGELRSEFIEAVEGSIKGREPAWGYDGDIEDALGKVKQYKKQHSSLPWKDEAHT